MLGRRRVAPSSWPSARIVASPSTSSVGGGGLCVCVRWRARYQRWRRRRLVREDDRPLESGGAEASMASSRAAASSPFPHTSRAVVYFASFLYSVTARHTGGNIFGIVFSPSWPSIYISSIKLSLLPPFGIVVCKRPRARVIYRRRIPLTFCISPRVLVLSGQLC